MTKLKLHVDALTVETFPTGRDVAPERGTVEGQDGSPSVAPYPGCTKLTICPCTPLYEA